MLPLVIAPVRHVYDRSFVRRRVRAVLLFLAGYAAIWMAGGVVLLGEVLAQHALAEGRIVPGDVVPLGPRLRRDGAGDGVEAVPIRDVAGKRKEVPLDHPWIATARAVGTCLGD